MTRNPDPIRQLDDDHFFRIRTRLLAWYRSHRRDLPWRNTADPYAIWLSEVMLQQTRVETVRPYFHRFMERFPTIRDLAAADLETVLKMWEGLGYYARARNFHKAANQVVSELGGRVPDTLEVFRSLPGVGEYIAAAVLSIAFGRPYAVVDGNVKRVLARLFRMEQPVNQSTAHPAFRELSQRILDPEAPADANQALMELGAMACTPRNPDCPACPLAGDCRAFRDDVAADYPRRAKKKAIPLRVQAAAVLARHGRVLVVRRPVEGLLGGLWEFPTVSLAKGECPASVLTQMLQDRFGLAGGVAAELLGTVHHVYTHFRLEKQVFRCVDMGNGPLPAEGETVRWIEPGAGGEPPFHGAALKVFALLANGGKISIGKGTD
ncbi:MAG: A/G-specific adenine glycosylase [Desulfococcaceae bacterium]